ncbi:hypothetical protein K7W03_26730, partial [Sphingobium sp. PNB]|nr:hypothetical protein [Sphingobium sp. PNB]
RPPPFTDTPTTDSHLDCRYARILSVAAQSTAQRRVVEMEQQGLLMRELSDRDRRCIGVEMTERGVEKVNSLLDRLIGICQASPL